MAGAAVEGELSATARGADATGSARGAADVEFAVATRADEAELRALLRETPTRGGAVSLGFEREPDYFAGENVDGAKDTTIVARRGGRVVCMGRCSRRLVYVGGEKREAGYLGELRLAPGTRGGLAVLRAGYAFFAQYEAARAEGAADFYFTSVATGNARARAVLENGRKMGLPEYVARAELVTVAWPVRRAARAARAAGAAETKMSEEAKDELSYFLDTEARRLALAMPWVAETWASLAAHGLKTEDFCVVRRAGRILAAGGVWDQSAWRQTVVAGYAGVLKWGRGLVNAAAWAAGRPGLPAVGERLRQACVHPLAVAVDASAAEVGELLGKLEACAARRKVEWLAASVAAEDGLRALLARRAGARDYATRLYEVRLPGLTTRGGFEVNGQRVRPEAGFL